MDAFTFVKKVLEEYFNKIFGTDFLLLSHCVAIDEKSWQHFIQVGIEFFMLT